MGFTTVSFTKFAAMGFTKKERKKIYKEAIKMYQKDFWYKEEGTCIVLHHAVRKLFGTHISISEIPDYFLEFKLFKPEDAMFDDLWFENDHERLVVLEFCILMLEQ
jgi:hypothetical protein